MNPNDEWPRKLYGTIYEPPEPYELPIELQGLWFLFKTLIFILGLITFFSML